MLFENRVCDRAMALVDPLLSWAAGRDQFTNIIDSGRLPLGIRPMAAFGELLQNLIGEFDPGSGRTLAACLTHASHGG